MKLFAFLGAWPFAVGFVTASPVPTNPQSLEVSPQAPEGHKALLLWDPPQAYKSRQKRKSQWEQICDEALTRAGCGLGKIHKGETTSTKNGRKTPYLMVEGAPFMGLGLGYEKKMRIFLDGSSEDGWSPRDERSVKMAKRLKRTPRPLEDPQPEEQGRTPLLSWDPEDAYERRSKRRSYWEDRCRRALIRADCGVGVIHQGAVRFTKPNGDKTSYINVEGAEFVGQNKEEKKKMRVFEDGSSQYGWSGQDRVLIRHAKYKYPTEDSQPWAGPTTLLSWDPADAYPNRRHKRLRWEKMCDQALNKEGCGVGRIHQGETKSTRNGTIYLRVEGAPSMGMEYGKKMRVFQDGSYENGWSRRDQRLMADAKRQIHRRRKVRQLRPPERQQPGHGPVEASTV